MYKIWSCVLFFTFLGSNCSSSEESKTKQYLIDDNSYHSLIWVKEPYVFKGYCDAGKNRCIPLPKYFMKGYKVNFKYNKSATEQYFQDQWASSQESYKRSLLASRVNHPVVLVEKQKISQAWTEYDKTKRNLALQEGSVSKLQKDLTPLLEYESDYNEIIQNIERLVKAGTKPEEIETMKQNLSSNLESVQLDIKSVQEKITQSEILVKSSKESLISTTEKWRKSKTDYDAVFAKIDGEVKNEYVLGSLKSAKNLVKALPEAFNKLEQNIPYTSRTSSDPIYSILKNLASRITNQSGGSEDLKPFN